MGITTTCPACRHRLRVPERLAGRRVTCPRCDAPVGVPKPLDTPTESKTKPAESPLATEPDGALPRSAHLGTLSLVLGLSSVLVLCIPYVGYAALVLSGTGLLLGFAGVFDGMLYTSGRRGSGAVVRAASWRTPALGWPLAGVGTCLFVLFLALWPLLHAHSPGNVSP
jgi:hypothetical protein